MLSSAPVRPQDSSLSEINPTWSQEKEIQPHQSTKQCNSGFWKCHHLPVLSLQPTIRLLVILAYPGEAAYIDSCSPTPQATVCIQDCRGLVVWFGRWLLANRRGWFSAAASIIWRLWGSRQYIIIQVNLICIVELWVLKDEVLTMESSNFSVCFLCFILVDLEPIVKCFIKKCTRPPCPTLGNNSWLETLSIAYEISKAIPSMQVSDLSLLRGSKDKWWISKPLIIRYTCYCQQWYQLQRPHLKYISKNVFSISGYTLLLHLIRVHLIET